MIAMDVLKHENPAIITDSELDWKMPVATSLCPRPFLIS
jgi:hypothetical protein